MAQIYLKSPIELMQYKGVCDKLGWMTQQNLIEMPQLDAILIIAAFSEAFKTYRLKYILNDDHIKL